MQSVEYEKGLLVQAVWRLARSSDTNELLAVGCALRNWIIRRGPLSPGQKYFSNYTEAIAEFMETYPLRSLPKINEPALIDPREGLLARIDGIYDCSAVDLASSHVNTQGARYFGAAREIGSGSKFDREVLSNQGAHPLIGTFGSLQFYV